MAHGKVPRIYKRQIKREKHVMPFLSVIQIIILGHWRVVLSSIVIDELLGDLLAFNIMQI